KITKRVVNLLGRQDESIKYRPLVRSFIVSKKTAIFKNVRDKGKYFAIENQKNAVFLKFGQQKKPAFAGHTI
ncbi:hypothetical protein, partial [Streptococcus suis]|uniref:hypothetical protein n=1 Tax=Streptococcus suis TaxID=1307 RepID=UPI001EE72DF3